MQQIQAQNCNISKQVTHLGVKEWIKSREELFLSFPACNAVCLVPESLELHVHENHLDLVQMLVPIPPVQVGPESLHLSQAPKWRLCWSRDSFILQDYFIITSQSSPSPLFWVPELTTTITLLGNFRVSGLSPTTLIGYRIEHFGGPLRKQSKNWR